MTDIAPGTTEFSAKLPPDEKIVPIKTNNLTKQSVAAIPAGEVVKPETPQKYSAVRRSSVSSVAEENRTITPPGPRPIENMTMPPVSKSVWQRFREKFH